MHFIGRKKNKKNRICQATLNVIINISIMTQTNGPIRIGNFYVELSKVLGKGATGQVYRGYHHKTHEPVAVKAIQMTQINNEVTHYLLEGEKKAMTTIKNPYVVKTHEIIQQKNCCYIFMEVCSNGTLKDYIKTKGKLSPAEAIQLFRKIIIGYTSIVDSLFIHRDLKAANILLRSNGDPVIIDFGYCEMIMGKRPMIAYNVGSPSYMSPETFAKNRYSEKSDIWSLGVILYEMLTGKTIDYGLHIKDYFANIQKEGKVYAKKQGMTSVCIDLLQMALQVDPEKRATIHKLKYIIDKSMIPKIQSQLRDTFSHAESTTNKYKSAQFCPIPQFSFESKAEQKQKQKKKKIERNLKLLRNSHQIQNDQPKIMPLMTNNFTNCGFQHQQQNEQLSPQFQFTQNISPKSHPSLRKSQQRINSPKSMIKQGNPFKQIDNKLAFRRVPVLQKATSLQETMTSLPNSGSLVSLRVI